MPPLTSPAPTPPSPKLRAAQKTGSCPHLGLLEDPHTCLAYPAEWNLCFQARPVAAVSLEQQRLLCLSPVYERCPVFQRERRRPLPRQLRGARRPLDRKWAVLALCLALLALAAWALWYYRPEGLLACWLSF